MGIANDPFDPRVVRAAYDTVAEDYASAFADDLEQLPVDRAVLAAAGEQFHPGLPVLDVGCGPGQVGAFIADLGGRVIGVDLAPEMLVVARRRNPTLPFACGDMRALPVRSATCGGVVAFYSAQHVARHDLPSILREFHRVLVDAGVLALAMHLGQGEHVSDQFLGHRIEPAGGTFYRRKELLDALAHAELDVESVRERDPLPHEHPSQRIYVIARS